MERVKRGRGKTQKAIIETSETDNNHVENLDEPVDKINDIQDKKSKARKRKGELQETVEIPIEEAEPVEPKKKAGKAKKVEEIKLSEENVPEPETEVLPPSPKKGRGNKKNVPVIAEPVEKKKSARGKKAQPEPVEESDEKSEPEPEVQPKVQSKQSGRNKKVTEEAAVVEPKPDRKRGRARGKQTEPDSTETVQTNDTPDAEEEPVEEPVKKVGRGRGKKPETEDKNNQVDTPTDDAKEASPKKGRARGKKAVEPPVATADTVNTVTENSPKVAVKKTKAATKSSKPSEPAKKLKLEEPSKITNLSSTPNDFSKINFEFEGKPWNLKISCWNIAGLRAWAQKKNGFSYLEAEKPDILCLQELKCAEKDLPAECHETGYHAYWWGNNSGHNGVALLSRSLPIEIKYGFDSKFDEECRSITAEFEKFYLVNVYVPNAGRGLKTLDKRLEWNTEFHKYLSTLDKKKPVILAGDLNVAHQEIDLKNPKTNKKNAGFTQEERDGMTDLLNLGFIDSFRHLYPDKVAYTFWSNMNNARAKDVGWRLDYFLVSERIMKNVVDSQMRKEVMGSDHCPILLYMNF